MAMGENEMKRELAKSIWEREREEGSASTLCIYYGIESIIGKWGECFVFAIGTMKHKVKIL